MRTGYAPRPMSDLLTAVASALQAPEELIRRSAEARAAATGASVDDILAAWAGGGGAVPAPQAPAAPEAPAPTPEPAPAPEPAATPESAPAPEPVAQEAATATALAEPEPAEPPVEAQPLAARARVAGRFGAWAGAVTGLVLVLAASPWLAPRATVIETGETFRPAVEAAPGATFLVVLLLLGAFGGFAAVFGRAAAGWMGPGWQLGSSWRSSVLLGVGAGLLGGAVVGGLLVSVFALEGAEDTVTIPVLAGSLVMILGTALVGRGAAMAVQALGVPRGALAESEEEMSSVRRLLGTAMSLPVAGLVTILILVLPSAWLFLTFPGAAPLLALFIAMGILGFAGLAASRPGMKISVGDFLVAAAGIGVVILIIVAVLLARGAGGGEGEQKVEGEAAVELVVL